MNTSVRLILFTDTERYPDCAPLIAICERAAPQTVLVVLRDKQRPVRERLQWAHTWGPRIRRAQQLFAVAERADLARALGADGVHLPAGGTPPALLRQKEPHYWLSRSIHDVEQLSPADLAALQALVVSPVCQPRKGREARGIEGLQQKREELSQRFPQVPPLFALGGVTVAEIPALLEAGAAGVAGIGLWHDSCPDELLHALRIHKSR